MCENLKCEQMNNERILKKLWSAKKSKQKLKQKSELRRKNFLIENKHKEKETLDLQKKSALLDVMFDVRAFQQLTFLFLCWSFTSEQIYISLLSIIDMKRKKFQSWKYEGFFRELV